MRCNKAVVLVATALAGCAVVPEPFTDIEVAAYSNDARERVVADQEPLTGPISLYEAMARALRYNLDKQVEVMELMLRERQLRVAHYSKLPEIVANAGYADRDNYSGATAVQLLGPRTLGQPSLVPSTTSERDVRTTDLAFSWHILDFGLSYVRSRQAADRVLIAAENRRRVINRIVEDVRTAYWRTVTASRLVHNVSRLEARVARALKETHALAASGASSPLTALTYERELVEIQREIRYLHGDLSTAKAQLAALINVDPGQSFEVILPSEQPEPRPVDLSAEEMVMTAISNRSELREVVYEQRINSAEAEAAILEILPGVSFGALPNWSSNSFLFNNHWVSWTAQASWNLMKVFSYPDRRAEIIAADDLLDKQALAVTMAIMTQVHVSRVRLIHARRKYRTAIQYYHVQQRILKQIRRALNAGKVSEQTAIREEMNALVARIKLDLAYVELQGAFANVYASMGVDPYFGFILGDESIQEVEQALRRSWRDRGDRLALMGLGSPAQSVIAFG